MNERRLADILERALEAGITGETPNSNFIPELRCMDDDIQDELLGFLAIGHDLDCFDGKMFNLGYGGSVRVSHQLLAIHLLHRARNVGANQTSRELARFLELDHTPAYAILGIRGLELAEEVQITDDIRLVPYESAPESLSKSMADQAAGASEGVLMAPHLARSLRPRVALIMNIRISPKTHDVAKSQACPDCMDTLRRIRLLLTLVGRSTPVPSCCWVDLHEWVPCRDFLSSGVSGALMATEPLSLHEMTHGDCSDASTLVKQFLKLNPTDQTVLSTCLDRLNRSKRASNNIDKAIDLGIAMEVLLLHDRSEHDQISFTFRLRGAWLLADSGEERIEIERILSRIYTCRSQAVHAGKCKSPSKKMSLSSLLEQGQDLCAEAVRAILHKGGFPNWNKLILDAS